LNAWVSLSNAKQIRIALSGKPLLTADSFPVKLRANRARVEAHRFMDLADDERIKHLAELIQKETDRDKVLKLTRELCRILDHGGSGAKPPESKH